METRTIAARMSFPAPGGHVSVNGVRFAAGQMLDKLDGEDVIGCLLTMQMVDGFAEVRMQATTRV